MGHIRVALVVGTEGEYSRRVLRGVAAHVREAELPWLFAMTSPRSPDLRMLAEWRPAGVIALLTDRDLGRKLAAWGRPMVNVGFREVTEAPTVGNDDEAIGRMAAEHCLDRHFRHFAYAGRPGLRFAELRGAGFAARLRAAGRECLPGVIGDAVQPGTRADRVRLRRWVAGLPAGTAVFACNDVRAWQVLQTCRELGRRVPDEIAVLGVDNDEAWCLLSDPPLSSVAVAAEQVGRRAADALAGLLAGRRVPRFTPVPPPAVVTRQSTDVLAVADPVVAAAVRFIRDNAGRPLSVPEVARESAVSRRVLERAFRAALGHSPGAEVRRHRVRIARDLLATTDLPMAEVARRSGFPDARRFSEAFRRDASVTPSAYRGLHRPASAAGWVSD
jgi:LacI family transcriptional regulator